MPGLWKRFKMAVLRTHMRECRGGPRSRSRSPINVSFIVMEEVR